MRKRLAEHRHQQHDPGVLFVGGGRNENREMDLAKMRARQVAKTGGPLELVEKGVPTPGPGQVPVKVHAWGICHSDSLTVEGHGGARVGDMVAVRGIGGLGHPGAQFALRMGFHAVAIAQGEEKAALAKELGAPTYIDSTKGNQRSRGTRRLRNAGIMMCDDSAEGACTRRREWLRPERGALPLSHARKPHCKERDAEREGHRTHADHRKVDRAQRECGEHHRTGGRADRNSRRASRRHQPRRRARAGPQQAQGTDAERREERTLAELLSRIGE